MFETTMEIYCRDKDLDMTSFESNDVSFGELLLTLRVDASFSTGEVEVGLVWPCIW